MAVGATTPASAVTFSGNTAGCFGSSCSPAFAALFDQLGFAGNPFFFGTTTNGPLNVNLGGFAVTNPIIFLGDTDDNYSGQAFNLRVDFSSPTATNPAPATFSASLTGSLNWLTGGNLLIDFSDTPQHFTYAGGSFDFLVNDVVLSTTLRRPGDAEFLIGTISNVSAVPEASTWAMIIMGFAGVGFMGYRRSRKDTAAVEAA